MSVEVPNWRKVTASIEYVPLLTVDEVKIFKNTLVFCMQEKGEDMGVVLKRMRELQLFLWSFKLVYGSHFVFFLALPNMELQS